MVVTAAMVIVPRPLLLRPLIHPWETVNVVVAPIMEVGVGIPTATLTDVEGIKGDDGVDFGCICNLILIVLLKLSVPSTFLFQ